MNRAKPTKAEIEAALYRDINTVVIRDQDEALKDIKARLAAEQQDGNR